MAADRSIARSRIAGGFATHHRDYAEGRAVVTGHHVFVL
jgi:hypothetical protein